MTIFQIECFLAVAEHLNFAKAAEQLNVSQPAITRQIRTLEEELNTQLFIRNTRMVRLTENGRIFQSDAQVMATAARRSIQRFAKKDESNIIDFHIGCANPLHIELLSNTLARLRLDYPTLHPKIASYRKHILQMHWNVNNGLLPLDSGLQASKTLFIIKKSADPDSPACSKARCL